MTSSPEKQLETMIANLPEKTGKSLEAWIKIVAKTKLEKHGQIVKLLKDDYSVTHGFANLIATKVRDAAAGGANDSDDLVAAQYVGKEALKPLYDAIVKFANSLGTDVEIAPKKASVSLRRKKQFTLVTPATKSRIDLGLALKGDEPKGRLEKGNAMCSHKVRLETKKDFDAEVKTWMKEAYSRAG